MPNAIQMRQTGGPEILNWSMVYAGEPASGEVRLRQAGAGLDETDPFRTDQFILTFR